MSVAQNSVQRSRELCNVTQRNAAVAGNRGFTRPNFQRLSSLRDHRGGIGGTRARNGRGPRR